MITLPEERALYNDWREQWDIYQGFGHQRFHGLPGAQATGGRRLEFGASIGGCELPASAAGKAS